MTPWVSFSSIRKMSTGSGAMLPRPWWSERTVPAKPSYALFEETPLESHLAANLLTLARDLRDAGLRVGSGQVINLVGAVSVIDCNRRDDFYSAAKSTLVTSPEQIPVFDAIFARFWRRLLRPETLEQDALDQHRFDMPPAPSDSKQGAEVEKKKPQTGQGNESKDRAVMAVEDTGAEDQGKPRSSMRPPEDVIVFSAREVLRKKDFAQFSPDEIAEARRIISGMSWRLGTRETRRLEKAPHGDFIDYRRTLRHSLKHGGIPHRIATQTAQGEDASACADLRYLRFDGPLLPFAPAIRACARAWTRQCRGLRIQHSIDPDHPRAAQTQCRFGDRTGREIGARLVGRHAHRRVDQGVQLPVEPAGASFRRDGRDDLRWLGSR